MAIEMGIVSSSQLVRFMSVDVRPSVVRLVSRSTPPRCRAHSLGPPPPILAFLWKLGFEQAITIGGGIAYEAAHRGDRLKAEWDLAASNDAVVVANASAMVPHPRALVRRGAGTGGSGQGAGFYR